MKKSIIAACLLFSTSLLFVSCSQVREAAEGFLVAGGENVDYTFEYPSTWEKTRDDGMIAVKTSEESSNANISVTSFRPTEDISAVDEYYALYRKNFESTLGSYTEISNEEVALGKEKAKKISYTATVMGDTFKFASVICVHNKIVYTVTYTASESDFDTHSPTLDHVVESFLFS